jgi:PAS domain S-box-containing protein
MNEERPGGLEGRVLVLAPTARDAATSRGLLEAAGMPCVLCATIADVCGEAARGAGAAVVTAEAVLGDPEGRLARWLQSQPPWSDLPLVVLTPPGAETPRLLAALEAVGPMTLMKRPVQVSALVSTVRSALRDRRRQYAVRDLLAERQQAAAALRVERERYRITLSSIGDAVISTDAGGRVAYLNGVAESLTGWTQAEAAGRPLPEVFRVVNEHTRQAVANPTQRARREGAAGGLPSHTVLIAQDGRERPIEDSAAPMLDEAGATVGAVVVFRDVTGRREVEAEAQRLHREVEAERARLAEVFQHAPSFMCVLVGPDHVFERANDRYFELLGRRDILGRPVREAIPEVEGQGYLEILDRVYRTGEPFVGTEMRITLRRGGRMEERILEFVYQPIRGEGGQVSGILAHGIDLTDRVRAQQDLARLTAESERQRRVYETALSNTADFNYIFDLRGRFVYVNAALLALWGKQLHEAVGKNFFELDYPPELAARLQRQIQEVIDTRGPARDETPYTSAAGTRSYEYILVPVFGAGGAVEAVVGSTRDITDRKAMEDSLRQADRKKDDFIALLAHELRNPLAPIRNGLQVLRLAGGDASPAVTHARSMMERQLAHMVRLIDDLLDVSRINRGKMELRRARVALADVVSAAVETARPVIDAGGHTLSVELRGSPVFLDADLTRLAQVFSNLLTNSAKYTEPGGAIWVSAEQRGGSVVVSVQDTGIGIPADALENIFDMFSQVDRSMERNAGGLGIGLALVKGLVEMHGGSVTAASGGQGRGSTFTVTLPALPPQAGAAAASSSDNGAAAAGPKRRILVVDDNQDGAASLALVLRLMNNEVRTAHDGVEALAVAEAFRPEVVLMDVGMPRLNGLEATRLLRAQEWGKAMTVVALTGWGQEGDRQRSRQAGCDGHLVKPVSLDDLEKLLAELHAR